MVEKCVNDKVKRAELMPLNNCFMTFVYYDDNVTTGNMQKTLDIILFPCENQTKTLHNYCDKNHESILPQYNQPIASY